MVPAPDAALGEEKSPPNLYENLQSFRDFNDLSRDQHYIRLPSDWWVLTADVVDKSAAIEAGLYRDVNTIGAASVTGVKNALSTSIRDFPYVFTGDGATMIVPPHHVETAIAALVALRRLVEKNFNMQLRVGSVEIRDLEDAGGCVEVAKYEIAPGMNIAIFRGGGLRMADERIRKEGSASVVGDLEEKTAAETDTLESTNSRVASKVNLDTLMCRWEKIPTKQGCVMTLLVYDNPDVQGNVYDEVLAEIDEILNPSMAASSKKFNAGNPVIVEHLEFQSIGEILAHERRFYSSRWNIGYMLRAAEVVLAVIIFRLHMFQRLIINGPHYKAAQRTYADHRKFDDMLRMVIDCTKDQANAIEFMLQDKYNHGLRLFYGVHYSSHTIMTCLVEGTEDGEHVHFVDGDDGGYAMAAKTLRKQLNDAATNEFSTNFCLHEPMLSNILMDNDEDGKSVEMTFDHHMDGGDARIGGTSIEEDPFSMEAFGTVEECGIDTFFQQSDRNHPHSYHGGVLNEPSPVIEGVSDHEEETPHLEAVSDGEASPLAIPMTMDDGVLPLHVPSSRPLDPEFDVEQPATPLHSSPKKKKKKKKDDSEKKKKKKSKKKKSSKEPSTQGRFHDSVGCTANSTVSGGTDLEWGTTSISASHATTATSIASSSSTTRKSSHPFEPSATGPAWTSGAAWGSMSTSPEADETEGWTAEALAWEDTEWGTASSFRKASVV